VQAPFVIVRWVLGALVLVLVAGTPSLQERVASAAPKKSDDATRRAFELFDKSAESYRAGRFLEAAGMLREAYRLHPAASLQYNLARALEGAGDLHGAIDAYRSYLGSREQIPDRRSIEMRVTTLEKTLADQEQLRQQRENADTERKEAEAKLARERQEAQEKLEQERVDAERRIVAARAGREDRPASKARIAAPWIFAGVGVVGVVAGVVLGLDARSKHNEALGDSTGVTASNDQQTAQQFAAGTNVAFGVGGAIVAGGTIWGLVELARRHRVEEGRRRMSASR
jgi:tetratricopeptide (TPR) repeat protein